MKNSFSMIIAIAVVFLLLASIAQADVTRSEFQEEQQPLWTFSGVWGVGHNSFYLVDVLNNAINEYAVDGTLLHQQTPETLKIKGFRPSFIGRVDFENETQFVVESASGHFYWFNPVGFAYERDFNVLNTTNAKNETITGITTWTVCRSFILAFGDLKDGYGKEFSSYIRIPLDEPGKFVTHHDLRYSNKSPERLRHYYGHTFSAPLPPNEDGVVVLLDDLSLMEVKAGTAQREPSKVKHRSEVTWGTSRSIEPAEGFEPDPPWAASRQSAEKHDRRTRTLMRFKALEESTVVTNIFADLDYFYLVKRAGRDWSLERIDRKTLQSAGVRTLETDAHHIVLIADAEQLLVVEKQAVAGLGDQQIKEFFRLYQQDWF